MSRRVDFDHDKSAEYMNARSNRATVRNPLLALPSVAQLQALPPDAREAMRRILQDMSIDARARAEKCWRTKKPPMAAYWAAVAVYAKHMRRALV